jgi:hypothetical protein
MSLADSAMGTLKLIGMLSGAYLGYKYGYVAKTHLCKNYPTVDAYHKEYVAKYIDKSKITDKNFSNLTCSLGMTLVGYHAWPIVIAAATYKIMEDN